MGKANLGFQCKFFDPEAPRAGHIRELAPLLEDAALNHALMVALDSDVLLTWFADADDAESCLIAAFSHHGRPVNFSGERSGTFCLAKDKWWHSDSGLDPMSAVADLMAAAHLAFPAAFEDGGSHCQAWRRSTSASPVW
jgi:CRISPR-associated endonuclease/helicase Cas3